MQKNWESTLANFVITSSSTRSLAANSIEAYKAMLWEASRKYCEVISLKKSPLNFRAWSILSRFILTSPNFEISDYIRLELPYGTKAFYKILDVWRFLISWRSAHSLKGPQTLAKTSGHLEFHRNRATFGGPYSLREARGHRIEPFCWNALQFWASGLSRTPDLKKGAIFEI